jgi:hypothetical protein
MTELDVLRRAFDLVPGPDDATILAARAKLVAEIERPEVVAPLLKQRRWLRLAAAVAVGVAATLAGVFAFALPRGDTLTGPEIAAAAARALTPSRGVILHSVLRQSFDPAGVNGWRPSTTERWVATGTPQVVHERSQRLDWETGPCGSIRYDRLVNLLTFDHSFYPDYARQLADPAEEYVRAYRSGNVRYRGTSTFRGIPAYALVVSYPAYQFTVTYTVRRDNYYPLRTVRRYKRYSVIYTYSDFEQIPRNPATESLLHVTPRPNMFLLGPPFHRPRPRCRGFTSYERLNGRGEKP